MLEKHYGHPRNVASAAELTKGGTFKGEKKAKAVDACEQSPMDAPKHVAPAKTSEPFK